MFCLLEDARHVNLIAIYFMLLQLRCIVYLHLHHPYMASSLSSFIGSPSRGHVWILTATECYIEEITFERANGIMVANLIGDNIICRFGTPIFVVYDNGIHL